MCWFGRLSAQQLAVLRALQDGCQLKVHRTLDGAKTYRLHCPGAHALETGQETGQEIGQVLPAAAVELLERRGYLQSNMKFPAATLLLTERGRQAAAGAAQ